MRTTLKVVGVDQLALSTARPRGYVPRPTAIERRRIAEHGVLEPLAVRPIGRTSYEILSRPSVWVAAGQLGIHELPVVVHEGMSDAEAADIVSDHYLTARLNPMDEARDFVDQLVAVGGQKCRGSVTRLSRRLGIARSRLAHALRLLELPPEIQTLIERGELSPGHARPLVTVAGRQRQMQLARKIVADQLSVRGAEQLARDHRGDARSPVIQATVPAAPNADLQRLESRVTELVGCPFEIRGTEAVFNFFGDYEVLDGLLDHLGYRHA